MCETVCVYRVEQCDTEVLDDAVESHELEHTERCNEGRSTLPEEAGKLTVTKLDRNPFKGYSQ